LLKVRAVRAGCRRPDASVAAAPAGSDEAQTCGQESCREESAPAEGLGDGKGVKKLRATKLGGNWLLALFRRRPTLPAWLLRPFAAIQAGRQADQVSMVVLELTPVGALVVMRFLDFAGIVSRMQELEREIEMNRTASRIEKLYEGEHARLAAEIDQILKACSEDELRGLVREGGSDPDAVSRMSDAELAAFDNKGGMKEQMSRMSVAELGEELDWLTGWLERYRASATN
jgi:hypothetical protein